MVLFDIPLVVLVLSAIYLCGVYFGLGLWQRHAASRGKDKPMDSTKTMRPF
ncbi:hypothetical protein [[Limnothrix rosea] IAM M-220]|uniref:hypothetical protein n=1 Tax=[Limnothrix rosea] IAM M-220 TaxID=454133 RepID=UPI0015C54778|nr:hypothetical protein [[Limnothrix rosea] IAM M-220]